jgi:hypothetical protein
VQLALFRDNGVAVVLALPALEGGVVLGWARGRTHKVFRKEGAVFAQRSAMYLGVWAACFLVTQISGLFRVKGLVEFGLLSVAFSTAMLAAVAIVLLARRKAALGAAAAMALAAVSIVHAEQDDCGSESDDCASESAPSGGIGGGGGGSSTDNLNETAAGIVSSVFIFIFGSGVNAASSIAAATAESGASAVDEALDEPEPRPKSRPDLPPELEGLTINDGSWPDAPVGHVWYGEWVDQKTAVRWVREDLARRQAESDASWARTQAESEARAGAHDRKLAEEGFVYDKENDVWKPGPNHEETRQKEILERIRRQIENNAKIQDRMPMDQWGAIDDLGDKLIRGSNEETLDRLQRLGRAVYTQNYAATRREAAEAAMDAASAADRVVDARLALFNSAPDLCRMFASRKHEGVFVGLRHGAEFERELLFPFGIEDLTSWLFGQMQFSAGSSLPSPAKEAGADRLAALLHFADAFKARYARSFERAENPPPIGIASKDIFEAQENSRKVGDRRWIGRAVDEHLRAMLHPGGATQVGLPELDRAAIDRELRAMETEGLLKSAGKGKDPLFFPQAAMLHWAGDLMTWISTASLHDIQVVGGADAAPEAAEETLMYIVTGQSIWTILSEGLGRCGKDVGSARFGVRSGGMVEALDIATRFLLPADQAAVPAGFYSAAAPAAKEPARRAAFCGGCGKPLRTGVKFCTACGAAV